jgi:hypothetical protein
VSARPELRREVAFLDPRREPAAPSALLERREREELPSALAERRLVGVSSPSAERRVLVRPSPLAERRGLAVDVLLDELRVRVAPSLVDGEACEPTSAIASGPPLLTAAAAAVVSAAAACNCRISSVSCAIFLRSLESLETRLANFANTFD